MLLWTAVLLGGLVLALGEMAWLAALAARDPSAPARAVRRARLWHRLLGWTAVGWSLLLFWIFLDTLRAWVGP